jgi:hypothetical protein
MSQRVLLNLSNRPSVCGWYDVVLICRILKSTQNSFTYTDKKLVPLSVRTAWGVLYFVISVIYETSGFCWCCLIFDWDCKDISTGVI